METNGKSTQLDLNDLTYRLKSADKRYACMSKRFQYLYWALVPIYLVLIISDVIVKRSLLEIGSGLCFLMGMTLFALIFRSYYKEYNFVDYTLSTLIMLKKAARRYYPFHHKLWLVFLGLLCIDAGLALRESLGYETVRFQVIFFVAILVAFVVGMILWRVRYKPLRDEALRLIREIEEEGA